MALTHDAAVRNAQAILIRDRIDAGVGPGIVQILDAANVLLGTVTCADPCGTVTGPTLTYAAFTRDESADTSGTAAKFRVRDSAAALVYEGTVTATGGGGDLTVASTSITAGQPIEITSMSYTAPA